MKLVVGARTDVGRVRSGNEDSFMVHEPLFAVADGMGGHQGGEVASNLALETLQKASGPDDLADTVREANRAVYEKAAGNPRLAGMGTTLTAVIVETEQAFRLAHIGDSRLYLLRDGKLDRITTDHTVVERLVGEGRLTPAEAEIHPQRNILTRALGVDAEVEVDEERVDVRVGDRLLLCSDGLTGMVEDEEIHRILAEQGDPQAAADLLVEAANTAGGQDNITAVVIDVADEGGARQPGPTVAAEVPSPTQPAATIEAAAPPRPTRPAAPPRPERGDETFASAAPAPPRRRRGARVLLWVLIPLLLILAGGWALKTLWIDKQFYVGESNGSVALYRGIPAMPLGIELSEVEEPFPDLPAAEIRTFPEYETLNEGITAESREDALAIVERMRVTYSFAQQDTGPNAP